MAAPDAIAETHHEVVAQKIKTELMVSAISYIRLVRLLPRNRPQKLLDDAESAHEITLLIKGFFLRGFLAGSKIGVINKSAAMDEARDTEAESAVNLPHPNRIALCQIFIHGHNMHALASKRVRISRECGSQGLPLSR